jgi:SAM-dependent methyltransferase
MNKQIQSDLLKLVKDGYDRIADDFSVTRNKELWPEVLELARMVREGDRVLDAGCGNGRLLRAFEGKNFEYIGVDNSEGLIERAKMNNESRIMNHEFVVGDIVGLNKIVDGTFNFIFSIAVMPHLPGKDLRIEVLRQMKEKLADDGKIIVTAWNLWAQKKYLKLIWKFAWQKIVGENKMDFGDIVFDWKNSRGEKVSQRYYHAFTRSGLKKLAANAGLKIERLYKDKYNYYLILKNKGK